MSEAGLFLSFEGGEASGKSVQAKRLADSLRASGHAVVLTREPGGTPLGERIRDVVLHAKGVELIPQADALLFSAARAQLTHDVIRPALAKGSVVIADRYFDSTFAYQGYGRGAPLEGLRAVTEFAVGALKPTRTFLLDVSWEIAERRIRRREAVPSSGLKDQRWDRFHASDPEFHERLREGYHRLAAGEPGRIRLVPGDRDEDEIAHEIRADVDRLLVLSPG